MCNLWNTCAFILTILLTVFQNKGTIPTMLSKNVIIHLFSSSFCSKSQMFRTNGCNLLSVIYNKHFHIKVSISLNNPLIYYDYIKSYYEEWSIPE